MKRLLGIALAMCTVGLCIMASRASETAVSISPSPTALVTLSGGDSKIAEKSAYLISSKEALAEAWAKHKGDFEKDAPYGTSLAVNFEQCEVVALFTGEQVNVRRLRLVDVTTTGDHAIVRFTKESYQTAGEEGQTNTPFIFIILSRTSKSIGFEEGIQTYKGQEVEWKQYEPKLQRARN